MNTPFTLSFTDFACITSLQKTRALPANDQNPITLTLLSVSTDEGFLCLIKG